jgi:hypothetical protein
MAGSSMYEMLKKVLGPDYKDPRKLLANVWIIRDKDIPRETDRESHPWVMIETKNPVKPIYKACMISSSKRNALDVFLPAGTIEKDPIRFPKSCFIHIGGDNPCGLEESSIDKGEHKLDLPEKYKDNIIDNLSRLKNRRNRKSD